MLHLFSLPRLVALPCVCSSPMRRCSISLVSSHFTPAFLAASCFWCHPRSKYFPRFLKSWNRVSYCSLVSWLDVGERERERERGLPFSRGEMYLVPTALRSKLAYSSSLARSRGLLPLRGMDSLTRVSSDLTSIARPRPHTSLGHFSEGLESRKARRAALGRQRIGIKTPVSQNTSVERIEGYEQAHDHDWHDCVSLTLLHCKQRRNSSVKSNENDYASLAIRFNWPVTS